MTQELMKAIILIFSLWSHPESQLAVNPEQAHNMNMAYYNMLHMYELDADAIQDNRVLIVNAPLDVVNALTGMSIDNQCGVYMDAPAKIIFLATECEISEGLLVHELVHYLWSTGKPKHMYSSLMILNEGIAEVLELRFTSTKDEYRQTISSDLPYLKENYPDRTFNQWALAEKEDFTADHYRFARWYVHNMNIIVGDEWVNFGGSNRAWYTIAHNLLSIQFNSGIELEYNLEDLPTDNVYEGERSIYAFTSRK